MVDQGEDGTLSNVLVSVLTIPLCPISPSVYKMAGFLSDGDETALQSFIDWMIGEEHIIQFREDLKWLIYENNSKFNRWEEKNIVLKQQVSEGLKEARSTRWNFYAFLIGIIGIFVGLFGPFGVAVSAISLLLSLIGGLHKVTVEILAFENPHRQYRNRRLKFMSAWNRGVMTSWKAILVLPLGILVRYTPKRYKFALWFLDDMMANKYT